MKTKIGKACLWGCVAIVAVEFLTWIVLTLLSIHYGSFYWNGYVTIALRLAIVVLLVLLIKAKPQQKKGLMIALICVVAVNILTIIPVDVTLYMEPIGNNMYHGLVLRLYPGMRFGSIKVDWLGILFYTLFLATMISAFVCDKKLVDKPTKEDRIKQLEEEVERLKK